MEVAKTNDDGAAPSQAPNKAPKVAAGSPGQAGPSHWPKPSKVVNSVHHQRSSSLQRWMNQVQRAWAPVPREDGWKLTFNPEILVNQKRQWYRLNSRVDCQQHAEPMSLFEQFFIVGLHSDTNIVAKEDSFAKENTWNSKTAKPEILDLRSFPSQRTSLPPLEPQILFKYPQRKRLPMRVKDLPAFCFPKGIKARVLEKTPSMSDLNEVVYGQEHLCRDDFAFIFSLKVADSATLYGVCLHVQEIVQRPPHILGVVSQLPQSSGLCNHLLFSAPRCYCILTRVPFFELHYEMLNSIVAQERLERITQFVSELAVQDSILPAVTTHDQTDENFDSNEREGSASCTPLAIPIMPTAVGNVPVNMVQTYSVEPLEPHFPQSSSVSEASELSHPRELGDHTRKNPQHSDDFACKKVLRSHSDCFERINGIFECGQISTECGMNDHSVSCTLGCVSSSDSFFKCSVNSVELVEDDVDKVNNSHEQNATDEEVIEWAKENKNDWLQIVCGYHALPLPSRGSEIVFQPLDHLQPIKYGRPGISALGLGEKFSNVEPSDCSVEAVNISFFDKVNAKLAAAEEALSLSVWTTATICRALSLESVLAFLAGALLEKQIVVVCPNLGVLSATVLSIIPMIRPFEWQSLLLPVLPRKMLAFLDAPVPFIVGVQKKPNDTKMKTSNIVFINAHKDQAKMWSLPQLPRHKELVTQLGPIHARLSSENSIAQRHPVYKCNEVQAEAAGQFLNVMRCYLESLSSDLRSHTITSVQSNNDKVSLLLKESFIDSFPIKDRPFIKLFVETQLFSVLSDSRLSRFENE